MKQTRLQKFIAQHKPKRQKRKVWSYGGYDYDSAADMNMAKALTELGLKFKPYYKFSNCRGWEADFYISCIPNPGKLPIGTFILLEINGGIYQRMGHSTGRGIQRDYEKIRDAVVAGYMLLPFSSNEVMDGRAKKFLQERLLLKEWRNEIS